MSRPQPAEVSEAGPRELAVLDLRPDRFAVYLNQNRRFVASEDLRRVRVGLDQLELSLGSLHARQLGRGLRDPLDGAPLVPVFQEHPDDVVVGAADERVDPHVLSLPQGLLDPRQV